MKAQCETRDRILAAAEKVVAEQGAGHMTMDAVVARAGVSKGGLIYHFPTIRHLMKAMLQRFIEHLDRQMDIERARLPKSPGHELRAHIETWFSLRSDVRNVQAALLAAISRDPELLAIVRERRLARTKAILADAPDPDRGRLLLLAIEGLWMTELLQLSSYSDAERARIKKSILGLVNDWYPLEAPGKAARKKPEKNA
jgi:AcrR family transcriptional regulator